MQISINSSASITLDSKIQSSEFYEKAISTDETCASNYWYLGVSYLFSGREDDAQAAWFVPLSGANSDEIDTLTNELLVILDREANYQAKLLDLNKSWLIRQHSWSIAPDRVENILQLVVLANKLDLLTPELLDEWQLDLLIKTVSIGEIDESLLEETIFTLSKNIQNDLSLEIIKYCIQLFDHSRNKIITKVVVAAFDAFNQEGNGIFAIKLIEMCQTLSPDNLSVYQALVLLYSNSGSHDRSIAAAEHHYRLVSSPIDRLFGGYLIQRASLAAGNWQDGIEGKSTL
jgi:tetratricopeptide (TPR) repeat protein